MPHARRQVRAWRTRRQVASQHLGSGTLRSIVESFPLVRYNALRFHLKLEDSMGSTILSGWKKPNLVRSINLGAPGIQISDDGRKEEGDEACSTPTNIVNSITDDCSICTETFLGRDQVRILPCRHIYHRYCIDPWLIKVVGTCPVWYVV